jgi:hypothetical protein
MRPNSNNGMRRGRASPPIQSEDWFRLRADARERLPAILERRRDLRTQLKSRPEQIDGAASQDGQVGTARELDPLQAEYRSLDDKVRFLTRKYGLQSMDDDIR